MTSFTPEPALAGGIMIGLAAVILLLFNGRIAGISGIMGGMPAAPRGDRAWRLAFLAGLIAGPLLYPFLAGRPLAITVTDSWPLLIAGGLLVGFGTRLGQGCTSGHGVCGLARFSRRSLVATLVFLGAGFATVYIVRHVIG